MRRLGRFCLRWADPLLAVALTAGAAGALAAQGQLGDLPGALCVLGFCALVAGRRWHPVAVAVLAGLLIAIPDFAHDASTVNANATFVSGWAAVFLYSYALGADAPFPLSLVGIAALLVGVNLCDGGWNPVPEMLALGPYAAGLAVASRRRASAELEERARELEEEREIFAEQSVRYERARIARELHDIVAHSVSLMVVQANAGERLATVDPDRSRRGLHLHQRGGEAGRGGDRPAGRTAQRRRARLRVARAAHRRGAGGPGPGLGAGHHLPDQRGHR